MLKVLFRLLGRWRNHWQAVVIAFSVAFASLAADTLKPLAVRYGIDHGIVKGNHHELIVGVIFVLILYAARGVFAYGQNYMSEFLSQKVAYDLRNDLYNKIQGLSFSFHDRSQTGQLMSRVTVDVETSRQFLSTSLLNLVITFGRFIMIAVIVFNLNWQLALSIAVALPIVAYISANTAQTLRPIWLSVQQQEGVYSAVLQEVISGMRVVQAFTAEDREFDNFKSANWAVREQSLKANQIAAMYGLDPTAVGGQPATPMTYVNDEARTLNRAANIRPYLERLEAAISRALPNRQTVKFDADRTIRTDIKTRTEILGWQIADGRLSVNEARAIEDRPPVPGGDRHNFYTPLTPAAHPAQEPTRSTPTPTTEENHP